MAYREKKKDLQRRTGIPFLHAETAALKGEEAAQEAMGETTDSSSPQIPAHSETLSRVG